LYVRREGGTPEDRVMVFGEEDSTHSHLGGIHCSNNGRVVRNDLAEARRSVGDTEC